MCHVGTLLSNLGDDYHAWQARCEIGMGIGRTEWGKKGSSGLEDDGDRDLEGVCVTSVVRV